MTGHRRRRLGPMSGLRAAIQRRSHLDPGGGGNDARLTDAVTATASQVAYIYGGNEIDSVERTNETPWTVLRSGRSCPRRLVRAVASLSVKVRDNRGGLAGTWLDFYGLRSQLRQHAGTAQPRAFVP
jgi:hypothetical protein